MSNFPEVNLARRLIQKKGLRPPLNIILLAEQYAVVRKLPFPVDLDGVTLNLKRSDRAPTIIVNSEKPIRRQRFTLAHELGHVLIPWHVGSIVDETEERRADLDVDYWYLEAEANRFASELLMPSEWTTQVTASFKNPIDIVSCVSRDADVSFEAATLKVVNCLPPGYVFAYVSPNGIERSGRSRDTIASAPQLGIWRGDPYLHADSHWVINRHGLEVHWWYFPKNLPFTTETKTGWREIFDRIVADICIPNEYIPKFKQRLSGILASANSSIRQDRSPSAVYSACVQRLNSRSSDVPYLAKFIQHERLGEFLSARISEYLKSSRVDNRGHD